MVWRLWTESASIETTLELWAAMLREVMTKVTANPAVPVPAHLAEALDPDWLTRAMRNGSKFSHTACPCREYLSHGARAGFD
jgi:hypothetical protein